MQVRQVNILMQFLFFSLIGFCAKATAQKTDSLLLIREFMQVNDTYKQMPLHLEFTMKNETNFITSEQDTASIEGKFYLQPGKAYIMMGEMEQVMDDSLMIIVSKQSRRIIVNTDIQPVSDQMQP